MHPPTIPPAALNSTSCCSRTAPGLLVVAAARRVAVAGTGVGVAISAMTGRADDAGAEAQAGKAQGTKLPKPNETMSRRITPPREIAGADAADASGPRPDVGTDPNRTADLETSARDRSVWHIVRSVGTTFRPIGTAAPGPRGERQQSRDAERGPIPASSQPTPSGAAKDATDQSWARRLNQIGRASCR